MEESKADLKKSLDKGFRSMQTQSDRSIHQALKVVQEDREKDKVLQVGFYDNLIF